MSKGKIESHLAKALSRWPMQTIFFNKISTGNETWYFACDTETKRQSSEWVGETSPWLKKLKFQTSRFDKCRMLINFSTMKAQRIHTVGKDSKCRVL